MTREKTTAITPTRDENYSEWYQAVIREADLAENSPVRGCMIVKPWGYALWERIQQRLDRKIKETGHSNFYFPVFVPLSLMNKEAEHVEGFAKECAVVTHHRLAVTEKGKLTPEAPLEDPLVVRPTSEVVIGEAYARWIQSYRDLPILGNQWANVVRWEMRPRLFLRTSEFLWQEGHTAHATRDEAIEETQKMLDVYRVLCEDFLAMPVVCGTKTTGEKFPGADITYCIESMMQDGKALQNGTSHFLGQNFAKAFDITFLSEKGTQELVWTTSWGVTTRLIGSLVMCHSDDNGLVLPPKLAPHHVVVVPLTGRVDHSEAITDYAKKVAEALGAKQYDNEPVRVHIDDRDRRPGEKMWGWTKKGVPLIVEIGARELEGQNVVVRCRVTGAKDIIPADHLIASIAERLSGMQKAIFDRAHAFRAGKTKRVQTSQDFYDFYKKADGFVLAYCVDCEANEKRLKEDLKVTPRCIPLETQNERGTCIFTGSSDAPLTLFARAY